MQTKSDNLPKNFCYLSMQGYSTHSHGRTRPCCFSRIETNSYMPGVDVDSVPYWKEHNNWNSPDIGDFINDPTAMEIRKKLLNNEIPKGCKGCFELEDQGIRSFRQTWNEIYVPHTDWDETAYMIAKMSSDKPWFIKAFEEGFFDEVLPNVRVINFIGGEPLVVEEHYAWLEHIIDQGWSKHIELHYNTNATTIPDRLLKIWDKFKGVVLSLSIDAIGDLAHYVRFPTKWRVIEKNMFKLAEFSKTRTGVKVHTHVTLSLMNLHDLPNILQWCQDQYTSWNYEWDWGVHGYQNCLPHFNIVDHPQHLHICNLPDDRKALMNTMLEEQHLKFKNADLRDWEQWAVDNIINLKNVLNQPQNETHWQHFIDNTNASDKFRKIDIHDYIPWIKDYF